jgi:hypothetical protein
MEAAYSAIPAARSRNLTTANQTSPLANCTFRFSGASFDHGSEYFAGHFEIAMADAR